MRSWTVLVILAFLFTRSQFSDCTGSSVRQNPPDESEESVAFDADAAIGPWSEPLSSSSVDISAYSLRIETPTHLSTLSCDLNQSFAEVQLALSLSSAIGTDNLLIEVIIDPTGTKDNAQVISASDYFKNGLNIVNIQPGRRLLTVSLVRRDNQQPVAQSIASFNVECNNSSAATATAAASKKYHRLPWPSPGESQHFNAGTSLQIRSPKNGSSVTCPSNMLFAIIPLEMDVVLSASLKHALLNSSTSHSGRSSNTRLKYDIIDSLQVLMFLEVSTDREKFVVISLRKYLDAGSGFNYLKNGTHLLGIALAIKETNEILTRTLISVEVNCNTIIGPGVEIIDPFQNVWSKVIYPAAATLGSYFDNTSITETAIDALGYSTTKFTAETPIIGLGIGKAGSTSLGDFLQRLLPQQKMVHHIYGEGGPCPRIPANIPSVTVDNGVVWPAIENHTMCTIATMMQAAIAADLPPLHYLQQEQCSVLIHIDSLEKESHVLPQLDALNMLLDAYPNAYYIFYTRDVEQHAQSILRFRDLVNRFQLAGLLDRFPEQQQLLNLEQLLAAFLIRFNRHIRSSFLRRGAAYRFLEIDIAADAHAAEKLAIFLGAGRFIEMSHKNANTDLV